MKKRIISLVLTMALLFGTVSGIIPVRVLASGNVDDYLIEESDIPLRLYYDEEASHGVSQGYDEVDTYFGSGSDLLTKHPNDDWERWSIPLGNGYFGANIFGRTGTERIQLTEKTLANPYRIQSGSTYTDGLNNFSETYIDFGHSNNAVTNYSRELDLKTAVSTVNYTYGGVNYSREYFTSYPDNAMVIKLDASVAGKLSFVLRPTVPYEQEYMNVEGDHGGKTGTVTSSVSNGVGTVVLSGNLEYYDIDFVTPITQADLVKVEAEMQKIIKGNFPIERFTLPRNEAIAYFKKAQPMRPKPRFTDCEDALSHICIIQGDIDGAIAAQKEMLQIVREDWTTEGECVDHILREIQRLEALKQ